MNKLKIAVTGAGGYLGVGIVKKLCDDGNDVVAVCHHTSTNIDSRAKVVYCDIFSLSDPYNTFGKPDVILHLAWRNGFVHNDLSHVHDLSKHFDFLHKMAISGVKKIVVLGTMHEVGFFEGSINEETPTKPESLYGISKDALRNMTKLICKENNVVFQWLRGFYIVGNSDFGCSIFSKITKAEKEGRTLFPFTSGQNQWDFLDYDEFVKQTVATVEQNKINGIINICHGRPEKLADRVEKYIKDNKYCIKLDYGKYPDRPYDSKAVWGDDTKIKIIMKTKAMD